MSLPLTPAADGAALVVRSNQQVWHVRWHGAMPRPSGSDHGASAICVSKHGRVLLVSRDAVLWGLPGGRPEHDETPRQTLAREIREEAGADVVSATLLGYSVSHCVAGAQAGTTLVRSFWRARVTLLPWRPAYEIAHRQIFSPGDVEAILARSHPDGSAPLLVRAFRAAMAIAGH